MLDTIGHWQPSKPIVFDASQFQPMTAPTGTPPDPGVSPARDPVLGLSPLPHGTCVPSPFLVKLVGLTTGPPR